MYASLGITIYFLWPRVAYVPISEPEGPYGDITNIFKIKVSISGAAGA